MNNEFDSKIDKTSEWIREYCLNAGAQGTLVGLSGGIDSALVAHLIKRAFPQNSLGVILPCKSNPQDREHAIWAADSAGLRYVEVNLDDAHESIWSKVKGLYDDVHLKKVEFQNEQMSDANLRARLRMSTLYSIANSMNYLVAGTDNAAEILTGYFTKYGDGGVDYLPIAGLKKNEVYLWASHLSVPVEILDKAPSAGLWSGQTDESEMGVTYDEIDAYIDGKKIDEASKIKIESLSKRSEHKKKMPPGAPVF